MRSYADFPPELAERLEQWAEDSRDAFGTNGIDWDFEPGDDWPVHLPGPADAPIPGIHWYSGCDPDHPRVNPATGICEGCGESACRECGRSNCPDH